MTGSLRAPGWREQGINPRRDQGHAFSSRRDRGPRRRRPRPRRPSGSDTPSGVYLSRRRAVVYLDPQRDDDPEVQAFARIFLQRSLTSLNYATPGNVARRRPGPCPLVGPLGPPSRHLEVHAPAGRPLRGRLAGDGARCAVRGIPALRAGTPLPGPGPRAGPARRAGQLSRPLRGDPCTAGRLRARRRNVARRDDADVPSAPARAGLRPGRGAARVRSRAPGRDTRDRYDSRPLATGPYRNLPRQRSSARTRSEPCVVARDRRPTPGGGGAPVVVVFGDTASPPHR